jgi:uncharacterized iron-regulated protein
VKKEIVALRKRIFTYLKAKALNFESGVSPELILYRKDQETHAQREFSPTTIDDLKVIVKEKCTIYLGDFHTFDQNIRNVLRILKVILNEKNNCIVALEMVDAKYQFYIDTYLQGHITDLEFLESIDYHDSWRFPWTHYKLIFELAKENGIKIIGLNTTGNLIERDKFAAELISHTHKTHPDSQVLVLYGELHLTANKIPSLVKHKNKNLSSVIIHQNLDEVYWKQIELGKNDKVVKFNDDEYCINSAPPWIKYESMIYWYENLSNDPDFDIHEYIIENGKKIFGDDTHENFHLICQEMISAISIDFDLDQLEDFNLHDHTSLEFIEDKVLELPTKEIVSFYNYLFETGQSFKLPDETIFYCSSYSMNRMAYLAGIHIFHYFYRMKNQLAVATFNSEKKADKFILFCFESLFAFFFSKIINPHRKCEMYLDLRFKYSTVESSNKKKLYAIAADILDGQDLEGALEGLNLKRVHGVSLHVGHILGEYLYEGIFNQKKVINLEESFFKHQLSEFQFQRIRTLLLKNTNYKDHQKRYF